MKVCILSHCFYPSKKRGGPTVSITNLVQNLADKCDLSVISILFDKNTDKPYSNVSEGKNRLFNADIYYLKENNNKAFYSCLTQIKPDVLYVSSLFSYEYSIAAFMYAKFHKDVRIIVAPRGELMPLALKRKATAKLLFLSGIKATMPNNTEFHVTSDEEELAVRSIFGKNYIWKIKNLPSKVSGADSFLDKKSGSLSVVMIGRIHPIKNIDYAINLMNNVRGDVELDIYGPEEDIKYTESCKNSASELPDNVKVNFKGIVDHDEVGAVLRNHHVFLSPTESENYGHSIIESLLCGVPVVISNNTPWRGLEADFAGYDIDLSDRDLFVNALQRFIDMDNDTYRQYTSGAVSYIQSGLAVEETVEKYTEMFLKK